MAQFARGDQDSIEQLLDLGVMGLRLVEYLADELYWSLDLEHVPDLLTLDDDGSTDYPIGGHNVEQQSLAFLGRRQDRRRCKNYLCSTKVVLASSDHSNFSFALRSLKNGRPFSSSRNMNRLKVAMHPVNFWMSLTYFGGFIFMTTLTFSRLGCMPSQLTMLPSSMPDGTPNMHFLGFNFH
jgi:hypothetical protein